mgnify:CR=1 FL=1
MNNWLSSLVHARRHPTATKHREWTWNVVVAAHLSWAKIVGKYSLFHEIFGKFAFDRGSLILIARLLTRLLKKKNLIQWTGEKQKDTAIVSYCCNFQSTNKVVPWTLNICAKLLSLISQKWWFLTHKKTVISQIRARIHSPVRSLKIRIATWDESR